MESEVKDFFGCEGTESRSSCETIDKGHGRIEKRIYTLDTDIGWFTDRKQWKGLARAVRSPWAIENNLPWSLDVLFPPPAAKEAVPYFPSTFHSLIFFCSLENTAPTLTSVRLSAA